MKNAAELLMGKHVDDLVRLFDETFSASNTRLIKGGDEPEYIPANVKLDTSTDVSLSTHFSIRTSFHRIIVTRDYFSSALHEIAHWCVAGEARRLQHDYGYWYAADGRSLQQQIEFEHVEVKPQALEWLFSVACGIHFRVSADNLNAQLCASEAFKQAIVDQVHEYCRKGVNSRAEQWITRLSQYYQTMAGSSVLNTRHYSLAHLSP